ncbi:MAG: NAD-dependent protein deacylase [Eggerthellaceae bacterium]|jgi:NAD-dependent deacetylase
MLDTRQTQLQQELRQCVLASNNVVFFGGAGVSTESGIPDFRSSNGLWNESYRYPPEQVVSHSFFMAHPKDFYDFYRSKMLFPNAKPNKAHLQLARLEQTGHVRAVITQNIDGLHQAAGSKNVLELHGSVHRNFCMDCGARYSLEFIVNSEGVPTCERCGGTVRPDVVLYEEPLNENVIRAAIGAIRSADVLICAGTSLAVYPAAGFLEYFQGDTLAVINLSPTSLDKKADILLSAKVVEVFDWD